MKFLKTRNDIGTRITRHCNLSLAGYFAAAFCMLLFFSVQPVCAWELFVTPHDNNSDTMVVDVKPDDDFDGDGEANSQEFKNGSNPINARPSTPGFILQAGIEIGEELVLGLVSDIYLNSLQVPVFALELSRRYFWPASLADRAGQRSAPLGEQY
jgi:hypothetical protein